MTRLDKPSSKTPTGTAASPRGAGADARGPGTLLRRIPTPTLDLRPAVSFKRQLRRWSRFTPLTARLFNDLGHSAARRRAPGLWRAIVLQAPNTAWVGIDSALPEFRKLFARRRPAGPELDDELRAPDLDALLIWGGDETELTQHARAIRPDLPVIHIGLGPLNLWIDGSIYFAISVDWAGALDDAQRPSDLEAMLNRLDLGPHERSLIAAQKLCRLFGRTRPARQGLEPRQRIGIALQHPNDPRTRLGGPETMGPEELIDLALWAHPDSLVSAWVNRDIPGDMSRDLRRAAAERGLARPTTSRAALFQAVDRLCVHSANIGLEAIATGLPLDVWGTPYYAGWGLTTDHAPVPRRQRSLTREELI
ncbi:MAG: hypothetical protein AAFV96_03865, partial [Pseudomonadota bacterium]